MNEYNKAETVSDIENTLVVTLVVRGEGKEEGRKKGGKGGSEISDLYPAELEQLQVCI